jgi:hypothetical protein
MGAEPFKRKRLGAEMAKNDITVDEFVKTKVFPKYQPIVEELRRLIQRAAPDATEVMSYGIPNYRGKRGLAVISPAKTHITLAFSRGAEFEDKYGLLEGVGKVSKNLRFRDVKDINEEAFRYYMKQALKLDTE